MIFELSVFCKDRQIRKMKASRAFTSTVIVKTEKHHAQLLACMKILPIHINMYSFFEIIVHTGIVAIEKHLWLQIVPIQSDIAYFVESEKQ